ncbi:MAG: DUF512 domain-containing protein [Clostridia bacterium]|nr:DUF512 domain-containing protein [Clostridia bacterium]
MVKVSSIEKGSPAETAGLLAEDCIIKINGNDINDGLDYYFYTADSFLKIEAERQGKPLLLEVKKSEYEPLGAVFDTYLISEQRRCRNNCIFCFIDQNPKGMRESIYFKDDDERMGFLHGSYMTLTNLKDEDIARIIKMRISPVNLSVHTMNPDLRCKMMGNRFAGDCLRYLDELSEHGIAINAQLVLCPGINDGAELVYSMEQLFKLKSLQSVSAVPVGVTKHRDGLYPLRPFTKEEAARVIDDIAAFGGKCIAQRGVRMFYASDEFYLKAGRALPEEDEYDGYPQLENGVGMLRSHKEEFLWALEQAKECLPKGKIKPLKTAVATGMAAYSHICELVNEAKEAFPEADCKVYAVENEFYGHTVTVSGLVTGGDLIAALKDEETPEQLLLPCNMLRYERDMFLDNISVEQAEKALNTRIVICEKDGADLLYKLLGVDEEDFE